MRNALAMLVAFSLLALMLTAFALQSPIVAQGCTTRLDMPTSADRLVLGETLVVTAATVDETPETGVFYLFVNTIRQEGAAVFTPTEYLATRSTVFTFTALATGVVTFSGYAYGECYTNGVWYWTSASSATTPITVSQGAFVRYLPVMAK